MNNATVDFLERARDSVVSTTNTLEKKKILDGLVDIGYADQAYKIADEVGINLDADFTPHWVCGKVDCTCDHDYDEYSGN